MATFTLDGGSLSTAALGLNVRVTSTGSGSGYEEGSLYENYIDVSGGDYRIYFFTNEQADGGDDTFIAEFVPSAIAGDGSGSYLYYYMRGYVPEILLNYSDFKIVVLANWGEGNYPGSLAAGTTAIRDVCCPGVSDTWGRFPLKTDFNLNSGNLIPFYGVQEYSGVEFKEGETVDLPDPVNVLRAMAKVEVQLTNKDLSLYSVRLCRYNAEGYCAPQGLYDGTYVTSGSYAWAYDGLHLVGGANDSDQGDGDEGDGIRKVGFYNSLPSAEADPDNEVYETWTAYVPEYDNSGNDYCYIEVLFDDQLAELGTSDPFTVYFAGYDGRTVEEGGYFDIGRNVLYRFTLTYGDSFRVKAQEWNATFDNDYQF